MTARSDYHYMRHANHLAHTGLGRVGNGRPSVGCVVVKDGHVVGAARTGDGGAPHAEVAALEQAGSFSKGADLFVTLEPCAHHGNTPPCTDAIIKSEIKRCVIACHDPFDAVNGRGIQALENAGIIVAGGLLSEEAHETLRGFFSTLEKQRPFVTLKTAISLDGKIALENGESQWITGSDARRYGHILRAQHDAILIGVETFNNDDPALTIRLGDVIQNRVIIICDTHLRLDMNAKIIKQARSQPVWIFYKDDPDNKINALEEAGIRPIQSDPHNLAALLEIAAQGGITRLLVEGGAGIVTSFINSDLYDELVVFTAPKIIGSDAKGCVGTLGLSDMGAVQFLNHHTSRSLGPDRLDIYRKAI